MTISQKILNVIETRTELRGHQIANQRIGRANPQTIGERKVCTK